MAFIENLEGKFLIQKRCPEKGGECSFTGGLPKAGETSLEGVKEETKEELGIEIENPILFKQAKGKNTFCDLYYIKQDVNISKIIKQDEEVDAIDFKTIDEIKKMYENNNFKKGHYLMFLDCINYLNEK